MAMSEYSLSDIATASRENGFGGDTAWCMIILFAMIFGWGWQRLWLRQPWPRK